MSETTHYQDFAALFAAFPVMGKRLHSLLCDTGKPSGVSQQFTYCGDERNGEGRMVAFLQHGVRTYRFTVKDGTLRAFGRTQNMRRPTRMTLYGNRWSLYTGEPLLTD